MLTINASKVTGLLVVFACFIGCGSASAQVQIVIDNQGIPTADIQSISIAPNTGLISVITRVPYIVQPDDGEPPPPQAVAITAFNVSPGSLIVDNTVSVSWTTENAGSCTTSGDIPAWAGQTFTAAGPDLPTGSQGNILMSQVGTFEFALTCSGAVGEPVTETRFISVNPEPQPGECNPPQLQDGNVQNWADLFGFAFPLPTYSNLVVTIPRLGYLGLQFSTTGEVANGSLVTIEETFTTGRRLGALSKCEGDFDVPQECQYTWGTGGGILWSTDPNDTGKCVLEPNTQYFWNLTFTDGQTGSTTECGRAPCTTKLRVIKR